MLPHSSPMSAEAERAQRDASIVRSFIDGWASKDADLLLSLLADDCVYINQPLPPLKGQTDVGNVIKGILALTHNVKWKLTNVFSSNGAVCTERLDLWDFTGSGDWELRLPCVGMFDVNEEGKITGEW